jgi:RNA polymerase sigma factor (sigma-70 family)
MTAQVRMARVTEAARDEFRMLLDAHRRIILKVASTYAREATDRADLAQDIVMQCWRSYPDYDAKRSFSTWMYRVALNVAISFARGHELRRRYAVAFDDALPDDIAGFDAAGAESENDDRVRMLYRCIDALDPFNRALLILYLDERSQREIADILGITETNVATKIGRLKERLRNDMSEA